MTELLSYAEHNFRLAFDQHWHFRVDSPSWERRPPAFEPKHALAAAAAATVLPLAFGLWPWIMVTAITWAVVIGVSLWPFVNYVRWTREWQQCCRVVLAHVVEADERLSGRGGPGTPATLPAFAVLSFDRALRASPFGLKALADRLGMMANGGQTEIPTECDALARRLQKGLARSENGRWQIPAALAGNESTWLIRFELARAALPAGYLEGKPLLCFTLDRAGSWTQVLPLDVWWRPELEKLLAAAAAARSAAPVAEPAPAAR